MGLEMKPGSKNWYGRFRLNGVVHQVKLEGVEIEGVRPALISEEGDRTFERSRGKAQKEFERVVRELRGDPRAEKAIQRLVEIKTGREATFAKLAELPALWEAIPRRRAPTPRYAAHCKAVLKSLVDFMGKRQPSSAEFVAVTPELATEFLQKRAAEGASPKTWNDTLKLLRATFRHLHPQLTDGSNPFHGMITKATETVNREPFSPKELKAIIEESAKDSFTWPIIITGICTAMRKGDCCRLRWEDVDLEEEFVTVKTSKTGETAEIPMFPMLKEELRRRDLARRSKTVDVDVIAEEVPGAAQPALTGAARRGKAIGCIRTTHRHLQPGSREFCFPEQAALYEGNPDGITWRVKQVLTAAMKQVAIEEGKMLPEVPVEEVRRRAGAYLDSLPATERTARMRQVFDLYIAGQNINDVMAATGLSKGSISGHLNEIEKAIKCVLVRGKVRGAKADLLQDQREKGSRRASILDFHSFRVTWITLALAAGLPLEIVQRVTGHKTVDIVLKHYFRPDREDFRAAIMNAMPELLTAPVAGRALLSASAEGLRRDDAGHADLLEEALKALEGMNPRNWKKQRDAVTEFVRQAKELAEHAGSN